MVKFQSINLLTALGIIWLVIASCPIYAEEYEHLRREDNPILTRIAASLAARVNVSDSERFWLNQKHRVHIRVGQNPPFHFLTEQMPSGLSIDYARVICSTWQLECDFVVCTDLARAIAFAGTSKGIDLFTALHRSLEREQSLLFTNPYISSPHVIVAREDSGIANFADITDKLIVLEKNSISIDFIRTNIPKAKIIEVNNPFQALSDVALKKADVYVGHKIAVDFLLKEIGFNNLAVVASAPLPPKTLALAVRRDWPDFLSLIDKTLAVMRPEEHRQIIEYWEPIDRNSVISLDSAMRWGGFIIIFTLFLTSILWILRLRMEVQARRAIQEQLESEQRVLATLVTERTNALNQAEHANQAKNQFLAMMSHELRTPLSGMLGLIQALLNSEINHKQCAWLNAIYDAGQAELAQLSDILELSRIESGYIEICSEVCDLRGLVEAIATIFTPLATKKGINFNVEVDSTLPNLVWLDARRIRQILNNFLSNSIRFTNEGQITLQVAAQDGQLSFVVSDTGIGIKHEALERIFEPFKQENTSISRKYGGTGLGLAICKRLATAMDGTIECDSHVGKGSIFIFQLALHEYSATLITNTAPQPSLPKLLIMLVEDDELNQIATTALLESLGHCVVSSFNGEQALRACTTHRFDLILVDIHMPGMDGFELVNKLRTDFENTLIFALTADLTVINRKCDTAAIFDEILIKPFNENDFYQALANYLPELAQLSQPDQVQITDGLDRQQLVQTLAALPPNKQKAWLQLANDTLIKRVTDLQQYAATNDWLTLSKTAHQLVSSTSTLGLIELKKLAQELEQLSAQESATIEAHVIMAQIAKIKTLLPKSLDLINVLC